MSQTANAPVQTVSTQGGWQLPYQQYGLGQATAQYQNVHSPTQLVAGFSPQQNQAISGITSLATNNPTMGAADQYVQNVLSGNPAQNPYLSSEFNQAANTVQNRLESEFAGSGRNVVGSLPVQSDELNNLATQLYGGAYNTGVQQQENALSAAPQTVNTDLGLQEGLYGAGQGVQNLAQQYITAPQQFMQQYLNQVMQVPGQSVTASQPYSPVLQALGGAQVGGQWGSQIGSALGGALSNYLGTTSAGGSAVGGLLGSIAGSFA